MTSLAYPRRPPSWPAATLDRGVHEPRSTDLEYHRARGPDDVPTWSPSSATLIYGDYDAILVDALATYDQADALADWIDTKGRRLSRIYITHGHGDHWLGLARLIQRFPGAKGLATSEVLARVQFEAGPGMAGYWEGIFPGEVPTGADKVLPQLLTTDTIDLEGNELRVIRISQADTAESTVLYAPSLAAVVTGDLAYNEVHMMTAETGEAERAQWIVNLGEVAALEPTFVVAGHKKVENNNDPKIIGESQQISPGSCPKRPRPLASSPGWSNAIRIGATSARAGIPREQPSLGRTAR